MGCDIHGFIEVDKYGWGQWYECLNIKSIVGRNYGMFALLFGVRNESYFLPIAADRGMPERVSDRVKEAYEEWGGDAHSLSWITWEEISCINWNNQGTQLADCVFCFHPGEDMPFSSFAWASYLTEDDYTLLNQGYTIERLDPISKEAVLYRRQVQKFSDALSPGWQCLFDIMKRLTEHFYVDERNIVESRNLPALPKIESRVRLVVWFDN